jgi:hypothetical protein
MGLYNRTSNKSLDTTVPFVFVHHVKGAGLFMVDGHHRVGVAHFYGQDVNAIFLNTFSELYDTFLLADAELIPNIDSAPFIKSNLTRFATILPAKHKECAEMTGVRTFDDYAARIATGRYVSYTPWGEIIH